MIKILLDTDMGCDCDDVGALAILCGAVRRGEAELVGVTHAIDNPNGLFFIERMLSHYGISCPVGRCAKADFMNDEAYNTYVAPLAGEAPVCAYEDHPDSVTLMRRLLAAERGVTLVTIGSFVNFAAFLDSAPDDISPLDGRALAAQSLARICSMGGNFADASHAEFNIACDIPAAQTVAEHCPVSIIWCGFEVGKDIVTGAHLKELAEPSLLREAYGRYTTRHCAAQPFLRPSWDPATVHYALYPDGGLFERSEPVTVSFDDRGRTCYAHKGRDCYLKPAASSDEAAKVLNKLMR